MAGIVAGAGAGFHWMSLETQRRSSGMKMDLKGAVKKPTITTYLSSAQVQAASWLAIPYDSTFGYASLSQIACLQLAFVPEMVGRIGSSKPVLLLQSDHQAWKQVLGKP
jgi:hypothetical protein